MKLVDLQAIADKELGIDRDNLGEESLRIPKLHSKFLKLLSGERLLLKQFQMEKEVIRRDAWIYYSGKADPSVYQSKPFDLKVLKTDIQQFINSDAAVQRIQLKIAYQEEKVDYIIDTLKIISQRNWIIKNSIDYDKFMAGM